MKRVIIILILIMLTALPGQGRAADDVASINQEVQIKKTRLDELNQKIAEKEKEIAQKRSQTASLKNQIAILENRVAQTELTLEATATEIEKTALEIKVLDKKIEIEKNAVRRHQSYIAASLRGLYRTGEKGMVTALLARSTVSEFYDELRGLRLLQAALSQSLKTVKEQKADLEKQNEVKGDKRRRLESLRITLDRARDNLEEQKTDKRILVTQSEESTRSLAKLLSELRSEQQAIDREITSLESSLRAKLQGNERFRNLGKSVGALAWPVDPSRGITTQFHDPEYPFRYVFEHPGIDIRAYQGTPVRAAASGYVAKAKAPTSPRIYSYIMLIHSGGVSTVYGHLSGVAVGEEQFVEAGAIIGYSGGTPGTNGAGRLTTGPHLHFEVRSNGIPVNPLDYLGN